MAKNKQYQRLDNLPLSQNSREKLIEYGPTNLKDHELLENIFITGYKDENVRELSKRILDDYGNKGFLKIKNIQEIMETVHIPPVKACQLISTLELGRRYFSPQQNEFPTIRSPEDAYKCFEHMERYKKETLEAIYLNARNRVIHHEVISIGTLEQTFMDPGLIFEPAISTHALGIIIAHNHPSGSWHPSLSDRQATKDLLKSGQLLHRPLLDHLIIGLGGYYSIIEEQEGIGFLKE